MRTLIIGIGNPIRGDDGLGWKVADELSLELHREDVQIIATQQLTPEIAEVVSRADHILFIDASRSGETGTMRCRRVLPDTQPVRHSHVVSPAALLALTERLYGRRPTGCLLTIAGDSFDPGESLSRAVSAALPAMRLQLQRLIDNESWESLMDDAGS